MRKKKYESVVLFVVDGVADQRFLRFLSGLFITTLILDGAIYYHIYICSWDTMMLHTDLSLILF